MQFEISSYILLCLILSIILSLTTKIKLFEAFNMMVAFILLLIIYKDDSYHVTVIDKMLVSIIAIFIILYWYQYFIKNVLKDSAISNPASW